MKIKLLGVALSTALAQPSYSPHHENYCVFQNVGFDTYGSARWVSLALFLNEQNKTRTEWDGIEQKI